MKQIIFLIISLLITTHVSAANSVTLTMVSPSPLSDLTAGYSGVKIADITITNDRANSRFTLTVSGTATPAGKLQSTSGLSQTGDLLDFDLTLKEGSGGALGDTVTNTTPTPLLGTYQSFATGDLSIVFTVSGPGTHASGKVYELWFRTSAATYLLAGDFQTAFQVSLEDDV